MYNYDTHITTYIKSKAIPNHTRNDIKNDYKVSEMIHDQLTL